MNEKIQYSGLSLLKAYQFLGNNGLKDEADEIRNSKDKFKSYIGTLRCAKIIGLLKENNLLDRFVEEEWPAGKTKELEQFRGTQFLF